MNGTPTTNSYLGLDVSVHSSVVIQVSGTFGGGLVYVECSNSSTNGVDGYWATLTTRSLSGVGAVLSDSLSIAGLYRGNASAMTWVRLRCMGATTPSIAVVMRASTADGPVALNGTLPAGTNMIGTIAPAAATSVISSASLLVTSFTALAANTARKAATFYNESNNVVYLALALTASVTAYTVQIPAGGYYELPGTSTVYTGLVAGIALVATGSIRVTELT